MEGLDPTLLGFIYSSIGILIGWILTQLGQWINTRHEDKKSLRQVIYNLLETYHWLIRCDFEYLSNLISTKVMERIPENDRTQENWDKMNEVYLEFIQHHIKPQFETNLKSIEDSYLLTLESLANIYPLTAFVLRGKTSFLNRLELLEDSSSFWKKLYPNEIEEIELSQKKATRIIKSGLLTNEINELEKVILKLSWKIGLRLWLNTKIGLAKMQEMVTIELEKNIDELFNQMVPDKK